MSDKPEALRLADECESRRVMNWVHATGETPRAVGTRPSEHDQRVAAELRRLHAECEALRADAGRWNYVATHWSDAQIHWNRDQTFKSMALTIKATHPATNSAVVALAQEIDAAMEQTK